MRMKTPSDLYAKAFFKVCQGERAGQALVNALIRHRPDIALKLRGSDIDPSEEEADHLVPWAVSFVNEHWYDNAEIYIEGWVLVTCEAPCSSHGSSTRW